MFLRRILVLSLVLPQLALGQVAVKASASYTDAEAQLLNRAARAELRGYAIQQEMQTLDEAFAKDPGYKWTAEQIHRSVMSPKDLSAEKRARILKVSLLVTGVSTAFWFGRYFFLKSKDGLGAGAILLGASIFLLGVFVDGNPAYSRAESQADALASFRAFVTEQALEDDLASSRADLIDSFFPLGEKKWRAARDTFTAEFRRGNFGLDSAVLRKTKVLTESQIAIFEKFQKDAGASLSREPLVAEVNAKNLGADAISHLEDLLKEVERRMLKLESIVALPSKVAGGSSAKQLHARHVIWSNEIHALILSLSDGLHHIEAQR